MRRGGDRRPRLLVVSLLSMFFVMPVLAVLAIVIVDAPAATEIAVVALALSPVPTLVAKNQLFTGRRADFAVALTVVASAAAVVITPTIAAFVGAVLDEPATAEPRLLALFVGGFVLAGIVVGHAVLRGYPDEAHVLATANFSRHPRSRSPSRRRAFPARSSPP